MEFDFCICGVPLRLKTDQKLPISRDALRFLMPGSPLCTVECRTTKNVEPFGVHQADKRDGVVFRDGKTVVRCVTAGQRYPAMLSYDLGQADCAVLAVEVSDWHWAMDDLRLWATISLGQLLLPWRVLLFHASCVEINGQAVLFTAPSGTGKSTQAELWRKYRGAEIINGDKAGVSLRESPMAHGVPFSGTSGICKNVSLPLKAIVILEQAKENTVHRLRPSQAVSALAPNLFVDQAVPEEWSLALSLLLDLVAQVPVYRSACTPDIRAVEALEQAMKEV